MQTVLLSPVGEAGIKQTSVNPRPASIKGITIGVVDNTKPNFDILMDTICDQLVNVFGVGKVIRYRKPGRTLGVSKEVLDDIKANCDLVFTGLGDWGSCTSWSLHDTVEIEKLGVPDILITTTSFSALARMEAKAKGLGNVQILTVPHPVGAGQLPEQVKAKAMAAMEECVHMMTTIV